MKRCPLCDRGPLLAYGRRAGTDTHQVRCQRCGEYYIDALAVHPVSQRSFDDRCNMSAVTRRASDSGRTLEIMQTDIQRLIDSAPRWTSPFEGLDRLLLLIASRAKRLVGPARIDKEVDYPLICARGPDEVNDLMHLGWQSHLLVENKPVITVEGLRRVDALRERQPRSRQAFVAMSFASELDNAWANGFKPGIEDTRFYTAVRIDRIEYNEKIDDRIVAEIRRSNLVVGDFTGNRPGVYFEAGYGLGFGLTVIWTCREDCINDVHFDTRQYNHIVWATPEQLRARLNDRIAATALPRDWRAV